MNDLKIKGRIAEILEGGKVLAHNICVVIQETNELGIKPSFPSSNFELNQRLI